MTGLLYNQFAITIAIAVVLSSINALTLSPALCAVLLRPEVTTKNVFFRAFNRGYEGLADGYAASVRFLSRIWYLVLVVFVGLCVLAAYVFSTIPKGFLPEEDQGYVIALAQLPQGASVERTEAVMAEVTRMALETPGVARTMEVSGFNNMDKLKQPYAGYAMVVLDPFEERTTPDLQLGPILTRLRAKLATIPDGRVMVRNAPAVPGLGATGGFAFQIQDLSSQGIDALGAVAKNFIAAARQRPELAGIFTTYNGEVPKRFINVDRIKVKTSQVSITELFDTLQIFLGSLYVNEFNKFGRVYRVYVQAEEDARDEISDIGRLRVRNKNGEMIPLDALVTIEPIVGPYNIPHYNSYRSIPIAGRPAPGYSSGDAIAAMEELAETVIPEGFGFEWTGVTYQQLKAGNLVPVAFGLALVFVFLVLAALYESWLMPFTILLSTPFGLLGAVGALHLRGMELDVYGQIALVMLIGLVAKNAILVVEFAKELRDQGKGIIEAATTAARLRLRPVLMTSFSFIIGLLPLMVATGPGSISRQSIGTAVVGGLAFATITIMFVPVFFVVIERLREGWASRGKDQTVAVDNPSDTAVS
jgi:HAE1 family hydrophobic/amphiphilic exporter-1